MRLRWLPLVAALAVGLPVIAAQQPAFRAEINLVRFGVTVPDGAGGFLADLRAEDFAVVEDGVPQTVTFFARGDEAAAGPEMHVGLVFDTSGSMERDISLARSAAVRFLNTLRDAIDMTLVDFDTEVRVARYGQLDFPRLVERIRDRKPEGFTALYDAVGVYLDGASDDDGRTILVLYTDGGDTRSTIRLPELMTLIRASDVTIHVVGFLNNQPGMVRGEQRARLSQMAEATGGLSFFPTTMQDVEAAYGKVVAQIRAQYTLGYVSTRTLEDGRWRNVDIRVRRPGLTRRRVQARKGYFAPYRP